MSRKYPRTEVKALYGLSAGRCSFPNCRSELILERTSDGKQQQIGEIAHIVAHSDDGPRGDSTYPKDKLDTAENWILLCPTCHAIIDALDTKYTITGLRELKAKHYEWVNNCLRKEITTIDFAELEVVTRALLNACVPPSEDFTVTPPKEKLQRNSLSNQVHLLLTIGLSRAYEVRNFMQQFALIDTDFPNRLMGGFAVEYNRLRSTGVSGDALFESMHDFSCGGTLDFKRRATGLAVLSYLFECCEIFEK